MTTSRSLGAVRPAAVHAPLGAGSRLPCAAAWFVMLLLGSIAAPHPAFAQGGFGLIQAARVVQVQEAPAEDDAPPARPIAIAIDAGDAADGMDDDVVVEPRPGIPAARRQLVVQQANQYAAALEGDLHALLALLRTLRPDLPVEDRRVIRRAGRRAVKEAAMRESERHFAPPENGGPAGDSLVEAVGQAIASTAKNLFGIESRRERSSAADFRTHLRDTLVQVVEVRLGADAAREFADELEARERRRRDLVLREVVLKLDDDLVLTLDQSEAIEEALRGAWSEALVLVGQNSMIQDGRPVYPGLPRRAVHRLLTESQRRRFGGEEESEMERLNRENWSRMSLFAGRRFNAPTEDPWWRE